MPSVGMALHDRTWTRQGEKDVPVFAHWVPLRPWSAAGGGGEARSRTTKSRSSTESTISCAVFPNCRKRNWSHSAKSGRSILSEKELHRRSALWQVERAARRGGPLLESIPEQLESSPLQQMTDEERLVADFHGSGMSAGPHPMSYCRAGALKTMNVKRACDLPRFRTANTRASLDA